MGYFCRIISVCKRPQNRSGHFYKPNVTLNKHFEPLHVSKQKEFKKTHEPGVTHHRPQNKIFLPNYKPKVTFSYPIYNGTCIYLCTVDETNVRLRYVNSFISSICYNCLQLYYFAQTAVQCIKFVMKTHH